MEEFVDQLRWQKIQFGRYDSDVDDTECFDELFYVILHKAFVDIL